MKAILYVIAIAAIGAGGWFSYDSMSKFQKLQDARVQLDKENEARKANIKDTDKKANAMEVEREAAKKSLAEAEANLGLMKEKNDLAKKQAASWTSKIAEQKEEIDKVQNLITQIKKTFAEQLGGEVKLDQIPGLVKQLEENLKDANKKLEELETNVGAAKARVARNEEQIQDLNGRIAKRANRIRGNSAEGHITAVNHDWGFVTVRVPGNMPITTASKLLVKRGSRYIGDLKINAIEGSRVIADIDYKSMAPGMVVQPGDSVVLTKPVTN